MLHGIAISSVDELYQMMMDESQVCCFSSGLSCNMAQASSIDFEPLALHVFQMRDCDSAVEPFILKEPHPPKTHS